MNYIILYLVMWYTCTLLFLYNSNSLLVASWYSAKVTDNFIINSLGQYLSLDTDHNGMLSKEELAR